LILEFCGAQIDNKALWNWLSVIIKSLSLYHIEIPPNKFYLFIRIMHLLFLYFYCKIKTYLFYATTVNILMGFKPQVYSHGALDFMMKCNGQIFLFSFLMLMWKSRYANASDGIKRKRNAEKING